jgi:hypothetical protein
MWVLWRNYMQKPLLRNSQDGFFYVISEEEFAEYSKFTECHIYLLKPELKKQLYSSTKHNADAACHASSLYETKFYAFD